MNDPKEQPASEPDWTAETQREYEEYLDSLESQSPWWLEREKSCQD